MVDFGAELGADPKANIMTEYIGLMNTAVNRELNSEEIDVINKFVNATKSLEQTFGTTYLAVGPKKVQLRLEITAGHLQPWGVTNGGVYSSLGESAGSIASYVAAGAGPAVMGTSNETHFLRPSRAGDVIISTATPEHIGRTTHMWRIEHVNEATGKLCALTNLKTTVAVGA